MDKWQYKLVVGNGRKVENELNQLAGDDWEPVGFSASFLNCACLVRKRKQGPTIAKATGFPAPEIPENDSP